MQELLSDTVVHSNGAANLRHIGTRGLTEGRDGVDGGDPLGKEGVGNQLGTLGRPQVGGEDLFTGDPVGVDRHKRLGSLEPLRRLLSTDKDTVRFGEITDSGTFSEELGVTKNLERDALFVTLEHAGNGLSGSHGHSTLLDHNLGTSGNFRDLAGAELAVLDVGRSSGTNTLGLRGSVDRNKDNVSGFDFTINVGGEEKVSAATLLDYLEQARFIDGKIVTIPCINLLLREIRNTDAYLKESMV